MSDDRSPPRASLDYIEQRRYGRTRDRTPTPHGQLASSTAERLQRVIETFHRDIDWLTHLVADRVSESSMASGSDRDLRRRFNRDPQPPNDAQPNSSVSPNPPSLPPLRLLGTRVRNPMGATAGSRSSRYRPVGGSIERRHWNINGTSLDEVDRNIEDTNSQLRALLSLTNNPIMPPRATPIMPPPLHGYDVAEESRRVKRRKLDSDRVTSSFKKFQYGKYGQVEPGQLHMEIVSCDGGMYSSDEHSYPPENILKNDDSVYCTKGNRCNIVLRHQGGTVFSLKELVIKAPETKYSCPVREGMVFVAMDSDELFTRTAQYQIQYSPTRTTSRGTVIFRHQEDESSVTRIRSRPLRAYSYGADDDDDDDDDEDYQTAQIPAEFTAPPPPFIITTECSSDDEIEVDHVSRPRPPRRRTPNRIGALPFESSDSSDEGIEIWGQTSREWPAFEGVTTRRRFPATSSRARGGRGGSRGASASAGAGNLTLEEAQEASQLATQEAVRAVGGELMTPLAHFFIEKDKNKCTVRFDPPVSGRFLLLKMWSPEQDCHDVPRNIDIEAVMAKGFAGPRYCPAVELV